MPFRADTLVDHTFFYLMVRDVPKVKKKTSANALINDGVVSSLPQGPTSQGFKARLIMR